MPLNILGGICKGMSLYVPKGNSVRPTSILLKRRIFDSRQNLEDMIFIDCCAGSGAMGLEAWSRGAQEVYLIEKNKKVFLNSTQKNRDRLCELQPDESAQRKIEVVLSDFERWLSRFIPQYQKWDSTKQKQTIIYFDPPYEDINLYKRVILQKIVSGEWFQGELWIESDELKGLTQDFWKSEGISGRKVFSQGSSYILIV